MTDPIKEYCSLEKQKRTLLDKKVEIDSQMEPLRELILAKSKETGHKILEVSPVGSEETQLIGASGALVVKTSNKYEDFNRGNLRNACLKFYKMLFPDQELANLEKIAHAQAEYMWAERECSQFLSIERTFVERQLARPQARNKPATKRQKVAPQPAELLPRTREDFHKLNFLEALTRDP
jgi:hypothetical protein